MIRTKYLTVLYASLMAAMLAFTQTASAESLNIAGSGGGLAQVMKTVYEESFTEETGVEVNAIATSNRAAALKAMMAAGSPTWDVSELNPVEYPMASQNGWLEPIDWAKVDPDNMLPDSAKLKDAVIAATYSAILAVRTDKTPAGQTMSSWADFWDIEKFPGPRALQNQPIDNLEFALIADGVAPGDVYKVLSTPEGVDRAFKKLDEIKPHIVSWWTTGAQPVQMLSDGEVYYTSSFNGRITKLAGEGIPVKIVWSGGALKPSYISIIKGTEHLEAAHAYIRHVTTNPERSAKFANMVPYPGFVKGLYDHIPEEKGRAMPTYPANLSQQFVTDALFWAENLTALKERWEEWLLD